MNFKIVSKKELLAVLLILVIAKLGINYLVTTNDFSAEHLKYNFYTSSMEKIDSKKLKSLISDKNINTGLIFLGRESCYDCVDAIDDIAKTFDKFKYSENNGKNKIYHYYYDTEKNNDDIFTEIKESLSIKSVPSVIMINNKEAYFIDSENVLSNLETSINQILYDEEEAYL